MKIFSFAAMALNAAFASCASFVFFRDRCVARAVCSNFRPMPFDRAPRCMLLLLLVVVVVFFFFFFFFSREVVCV